MNIETIIELWYETQHGHYLKCREAQIHFSEVMQELYDELIKDKLDLPTYQTHGDEPI